MRKSLFTRAILITGVYSLVFIILSVVQFIGGDNFNRKIGSLLINGKYASSEAVMPEESVGAETEIMIDDDATVFFGGLEFKLSDDSGFSFIDFDEIRRPLVPLSVSIVAESARFKLSDGSVITFYVQNNGGNEVLIISAGFAEDVLSIEMPYSLTRSSSARRSDSAFIAIYNKQEYAFDRMLYDTERPLILFDNKNPIITYRPVLARGNFNPTKFVVSGTMWKSAYDKIVRRWCDVSFNHWKDMISEGNGDEALISAFIAESAVRESYNNAVSSISDDFIKKNENRTYLSSTYFGHLEQTAHSIYQKEQEKDSYLTRLISENSMIFFLEYKIFNYLLQRSKTYLFDNAVAFIKTVRPESVTLEMCPGIFEGWMSFNKWHNGKENPFDTLVDKAKFIVSQSLVKDTENFRVFVVKNETADLLFNIRLGMAISESSELSGYGEWAAIGRSLVISALSFSNDEGALPVSVSFDSSNIFTETVPEERLDATLIYPYLEISRYYPHDIGADAVMVGTWIRTASPHIETAYKNSVLELAVDFPLASPHYLLVFGIKPFSRIQMMGMDYRTDNKFETYNSTGWRYMSQEQVLLVKLVHHTETEIIKVFF